MIKIPGTDEGVPGDRAGDLRGHQHQRHAAVRRRARTPRSPRPTSAASSAATPRACSLDVALGRVLLRLARRHRGRQAPRGARPRRPRRHRRARQRARRLRRATSRSSTASASPRCARPGARVQRPLWASTGVEEPGLPGDDVRRRPGRARHRQHDAAGDAARGRRARRRSSPTRARRDPTPELEALAAAGIDMDDVTDELLRRRASRRSSTPMDKLLAGIESAREAVVTGRPPAIEATIAERAPSAIAARVATRRRGARRAAHLGQGRVAVGRPGRAGDRRPARLADDRRRDARARRRARRVRARLPPPTGCTDAVLLGMGGSSLAPEVLWRTFGATAEALALHVLDSTDPAAIRAVEDAIDLEQTLFVVSTKSGGTIETLSLFEHFHSLVGRRQPLRRDHRPRQLAARAGARARLPRARSRTTRTSAAATRRCRYFGLVPAALIGAPVHALLERAAAAEQACAHFDSTDANPGLWLGLALGELARARPRQADVRRRRPGRELRPVGRAARRREHRQAGPGHPAGRRRAAARARAPTAPTASSCTCATTSAADADTDARIEALADAGHPTLTLAVDGAEDLGRMFFLAEFATAVAGWVLEINPFDQPNVQEAKDATKRVLAARAAARRCRSPTTRRCGRCSTARRPGGYIAMMGYVAPVRRVRRGGRRAARDADATRRGLATTFGYGPRFLHSTGQLHKGGPPIGRFLSLIGDERRRTSRSRAPGYSFRTLKRAQAVGDLETLRAPRPAGRDACALEGDPAERAARPARRGSRRCADADRLRRARQDGRQHGRADPARLRPRGRRVRLRRAGRRAAKATGATRRGVARAPGQGARAAADGLDHGPRRRPDPEDGRRARGAARTGRHDRRRRQLEAGPTTRSARARCARAGHPLRRRRHLRRRLGPRGRLLHDGRRPGERRPAAGADPRRARPADDADASRRSGRAAGSTSARAAPATT